ncbi:hypothetical protein Hanom_Chr12g01150011 [Helianthus anomalus]
MVGIELQPTLQLASFGTLSFRFVFIVCLIFNVSPVFANVLYICVCAQRWSDNDDGGGVNGNDGYLVSDKGSDHDSDVEVMVIAKLRPNCLILFSRLHVR